MKTLEESIMRPKQIGGGGGWGDDVENQNFAFQVMEHIKTQMDGSIRELKIQIAIIGSIENFLEIMNTA
jgi:hypothetical protein